MSAATSSNKSNKRYSVCVFGSSSKHTTQKFIVNSVTLGEEIAKRGYLCVNGAGSTGKKS